MSNDESPGPSTSDRLHMPQPHALSRVKREDDDETSSQCSSNMTGTSLGTGSINPLSSSYDIRMHQKAEDEMMNIASRMGIVKKEEKPVKKGISGSAENAEAEARGHYAYGRSLVKEVNLISPMGIKLSSFIKHAESLSTTLRTSEVTQIYLKPPTNKLRCRHIDLLSDSHTGTPEYYVIHSHQMLFMDLVEGLRHYFQMCKVKPDKAILWLDLFSVNYHRPVNPHDLQTISEIISKADKVLFVIDPEGTCFSRSWVMFELYQTLLSSSDRGDKLIPVIVGWEWTSLFHPFSTMDLSKSKASVEKDKQLISDLLKAGSSSTLHDFEKKLKDMMILGAKREALRAEKLSAVVPRRMIEAVSTQAWLLFLCGRFCEAEDVLRGVKSLIDRVALKELGPLDEPGEFKFKFKPLPSGVCL
jgi:hypothetical protein